LYDRERLMVQALDTLFSATCEGAGYIIFLTNMVQLLDPECPVSMAFLSHVIDRATLPSKDTMRCISPAILAKLNIKCSNQSDSKSIIYYQDGNEGRGKWSTRMAQYVVPSAMIRKHQHYLNGPMVVDAKMKRNALVIWAILAEKFAGNMVHLFWTPDVARTLFHYLGDTNEDWTVRVSALLTLEKFALTGKKKKKKKKKSYTLQKAIHDSHHYEQDIKKDNDILLLTPTSSSSSLTTIKTQDRMSTTEPHSMCISGLFNTFRKHHERPSIWDLTGLNVIMNPLDATQHWKLGSNGLELRNDRLHFESIRATVGVKKGRWYYEVLLVTEGIMQIGWCTKRCRFVAEEGYGVGDDQHGFAFDTYRSAVWANGSAVYPQQCSSQFRCRSGDVLGSYLDLEQGICSFFVNGKDLGMTVAFEHGNG
ncbi:concanavalin A-like lectin/glucanase domain-containing protein, partial [Halteromyces radiatus]|uniref:concanavalin A-like lectin/glucanase domain-containing protein n=1 Tax=Halteromyces radiatus TaxID=101107 RepID=UPI00221FC922